jgi:putative hemolysin
MEAAIIIGCLLLSAFFSGMEIAYVSSNKVYLGVEKKQSTFISKLLTRLTENPSQFLTAMLIGNSVVLVIYGYHMGNVVMRWLALYNGSLHFVGQLVIQVLVSAFVILLTAEFIPKVFFQVYANTLIKALAVPAYGFYVIFFYASRVVMAVSDFILVTVLRTRADTRKEFFSRVEIGLYITEQLTGSNEQEEVDSEIQIFRNALEFSGLKARDIMTPRTEISALEINDSVLNLRHLFVETGYSKVVIYRNTIDDILGYTDSFTLFKKPPTIQEILIETEYVPETIFIKDLLNLLTRKRKSMAIVLDEYGGTAGIITVEDIIEELFGEIEDEHDDEEEFIEEQLPDGSWRFSARLEVDYINETYGFAIPFGGSYTTLGGFIQHHSKEIPFTGSRTEWGRYAFITEVASGKKAELIKVVLLTKK